MQRVAKPLILNLFQNSTNCWANRIFPCFFNFKGYWDILRYYIQLLLIVTALIIVQTHQWLYLIWFSNILQESLSLLFSAGNDAGFSVSFMSGLEKSLMSLTILYHLYCLNQKFNGNFWNDSLDMYWICTNALPRKYNMVRIW